MSAAQQIAVRHFGKATVAKLAKRGVTFLSLTVIPSDGPMPFANGNTGYCVNDNGCGRVWTYADVRRFAE